MSLLNEQIELSATIDALRENIIRAKRSSNCPDGVGSGGGKGQFGFNSYNLLTFVILSYNIVSNIISNVNNNANNNNNNDNLFNFGMSNEAETSTSADNANKNMIMIFCYYKIITRVREGGPGTT